MLGFMSMTGIIGWLNIRNLRLTIRCPDEIYAGIPTQLSINIQRHGRIFPPYLLDVSLCESTLFFPLFTGKNSETRQMITTFHSRGKGEIPLPHVSSSFPIGFFIRTLPLPVAADFLVFPAPRRLPADSTATDREASGARELHRKGGEGELFSITGYSGWESLRQIHWRLSARHGELKVKQFAVTGGEPVTIELDSLPGDTETRLGTAAWLINSVHRSGRPVGLKIGDRLIAPDHSRSHRLQLLGELALHDIN